MQLVSLGADPEYILHKKQGSKRRYVASQRVIPGNKRRPFPMENGHVHRDNVLMEINPRPASTEEEFDNNIGNLLDEVASKYLTARGMAITNKTSHLFAERFIQTPEGSELGCDPDLCAWGVHYDPPFPPLVGNLRSAGGHIHFGLDSWDRAGLDHLIRMCDLYISVPLVLIDADTKRRQWYGQAGKYRPKSYGVEYRTPSNCWTFAAENRRWVFRQAQRAVKSNLEIAPVLGTMIQDVINKSDVDGAWALIGEFNLEVPHAAAV